MAIIHRTIIHRTIIHRTVLDRTVVAIVIMITDTVMDVVMGDTAADSDAIGKFNAALYNTVVVVTHVHFFKQLSI